MMMNHMFEMRVPPGQPLSTLIRGGVFFYELVDTVAAASVDIATHGKTRSGNLQQVSGMRWQPTGLIYDAELRTASDPVTQCYEDWMRTIVGSGGIGQITLSCAMYSPIDH
eukprot:6290321-Pyramimonas_sp.AAC.1